MDYIMKPLTEERLGKTIGRLLKTNKVATCQEKPFIQCFGGFEVFLNGEALTWKNSKAKEVLAFLVHKKGVPVGWEKIADAVWPEFNSEKAQSRLTPYVAVPGVDNTKNFTDYGTQSAWATYAVDFNINNGFIEGFNGQFKPKSNITRAETATVVLKLLQKSNLVDVRTKL